MPGYCFISCVQQQQWQTVAGKYKKPGSSIVWLRFKKQFLLTLAFVVCLSVMPLLDPDPACFNIKQVETCRRCLRPRIMLV